MWEYIYWITMAILGASFFYHLGAGMAWRRAGKMWEKRLKAEHGVDTLEAAEAKLMRQPKPRKTWLSGRTSAFL